jgi:hypothetical protein
VKTKNTNLRKAISRFTRGSEDISRVLETNFPEGTSNHLPFWSGVHTIRNTSITDNFNPQKPKVFELTEYNITKGYVEANNAKVIHFLGPKQKLVKPIMASYYHAIADDLAEIVYAIQKYPDAELIIDVSDVRGNLGQDSWDFIGFFLKCLDNKKIKYTLVELSKFDVIYMENFTLLSFPFHSGARLDLLAEFFNHYVTKPKQVPYRKVFVSRKKMPWRENTEHAENFSFKHDNRIDDHSKIEKVFEDLGFEVMYPEDFKNFQQQLDFFYSVKTLASLTSSGIVNAVFMPPGGTIIEIVTPLITKSPIVSNEYLKEHNIDPSDYEIDINTVQEIHMFYHNLAFMKEHAYVGIPNYFRDSDKVKNFIENNEALKEMLAK